MTIINSDPYLSAQYAIAFAKGMQEGDDPRYEVSYYLNSLRINF